MTTDFAAEGPIDQFKLAGSVLDRKFRIDAIVAEGGFGIVYRGMHLTLDKPVAVKVLKTPAEFNERARAQFIEKFALEGKTMARISHPNIVQVLDFGASEMPSGELAPWMVLEWINGQTLEDMLRARRGQGALSPAQVLTTLRPVLEALAYAHDEGIAHRDIKPANMMVVQGKRGSTVRLMDFGIAKLMEDGESAGTGATRTRTTMNAFSPQYAAPEQISGTRTGPWTDVHAMALIATEMLVDRTPYEGDDMTMLFGQILSPQRPTPARFGFDVAALEPVLVRATTLRPDERYPNAGEFLAAFEQAVAAAGGAVHTGAFPSQLTPGAMPSGVFLATSPTTLRGATARTETVAPASSRRGWLVAVGVVVLVGGVGSAVALTRGGHRDPPPPVPVVAAPATQPVLPLPMPAVVAQPVVAAEPPVAPSQVVAAPVPPTPQAPTSGGAIAAHDHAAEDLHVAPPHESVAPHTGGHAHGSAGHPPAGAHPSTPGTPAAPIVLE